MRRGDVWTAAGGQAYAGKPRPVVIVQDDRFGETDSIAVCPLTSDPTTAPLFRIPIEPSSDNGLRHRSYIMADKISAIPRTRIRDLIGRLAASDMAELNRAVVVFLGLAG